MSETRRANFVGMQAAMRVIVLAFVCCVLLLDAGNAYAETTPSLFSSFAGYVNFTGVGKTIRTANNDTDPCTVSSSSTTTTASLSGIPTGATIKAAYLYWAGSGSTGDYTVTFEGSSITAPSSRRYMASFTSGSTYYFFSGAADVTTTVSAKGNGVYSFSGLTVTSGSSSSYCGVEAVLGGWALLVIYEDSATEEFRVLNVYEGFQDFRYSSLTLNLSNFTVPSSFTKGRIAHITWEGDDTIGNDGESLTFNSTIMEDSTNADGNQFNSASTITGSAETSSWGVDFDVYDLTAPVIQAGQSSASTTYSSGQDLVLLSAEIIAIPNTPVADLGITLTRNDSLIFGQNTAYTISVTNNGPNAHTGTITVTSSLPSVLTYVSGGGSGWSCSASGQNVTCNYTGGTVASGASAPALTLTVIPDSITSSSVVVTVTVAGALFDNVSGNNSASDSTTMSTPSYVFTNGACTHNVSFSSSSQTCTVYSWTSYTAGSGASGIYITRLSGGVPTRFSNGSSTTRNTQFALSCHNPTTNAGIQATFSSSTQTATLPLCTASGATPSSYSSSISATYPAGSPSAGPFSFNYLDVGRVELFFRDVSSGSVGSSGTFVMKPAKFLLSAIKCTTENATNCGPEALSNSGNNPAASSSTGSRFLRAGYSFSVTATAATTGNAATPNYGRETSPETVKLTSSLVGNLGLSNNPSIGGSFGSFSNGVATGTNFTWNEVGIITLTPSVGDGDYLGGGDVSGTATGNVGRFYAAKFMVSNASLVNRTDLCPSATNCPSGFTYMGEQMTANFTLTAAALDGTTLQNYSPAGAWSKLDITANVSSGTSGPFKVAGVNSGASRTLFPACGVTAAHPCITPGNNGNDFSAGVASVSLPLTAHRGTSAVGPYSALEIGIAPQDTDDTIVDSYDIDTTNTSHTTSDRKKVVQADVRYGRLYISNAHGSELLRLPIPVAIQYWNGTAYVTNTTDTVTSFPNSGVGFLAWKTLPTGSVSVYSPTTISFTSGLGSYTLSAPGSGNRGSVEMNISTFSTYLPSNTARATFGVYKGNNQFIYIRENF